MSEENQKKKQKTRLWRVFYLGLSAEISFRSSF